MVERKLGFTILSCVMATLFLFSACGQQKGNDGQTSTQGSGSTSAAVTSSQGSAAQQKVDPLGKYDPVITVNVAKLVNNTTKFASGEDLENNIWAREYENKFGIKVKYAWTAPDQDQYKQKINIAIASDDLPDVAEFDPTVFGRVAKEGKVADITQIFNQHATDSFKTLMNTSDGLSLQAATIDGKLYGLAMLPGLVENAEILYIRSDWLKKMGLSAPKTMDDVVNLAKAFAAGDPDENGKKDTIGLGANKDLWEGTASLVGFFNGYNAFVKKIWIEKDGKLVFGAIQPEVKEPLKKLAELYNVGAIDKEFGVKGAWAEVPQDQVSGKIAMFYGPHWLPIYPLTDAFKNNPEAEYEYINLPSLNGSKPASSQIETQVSTIYAASVKYKTPEVLVKLMCISDDYLNNHNGTVDFHHSKDGLETFKYTVGWIGDQMTNVENQIEIAEAFKSGDASKLNWEAKSIYDGMKLFMQAPEATDYGQYEINKENGTMVRFADVYNNHWNYLNEFYGADTPTLVEKGSDLQSKQLEFFTRAIIQGNVDTEYDKWVKYFNDQGGDKITREVNDWYTAQRK